MPYHYVSVKNSLKIAAISALLILSSCATKPVKKQVEKTTQNQPMQEQPLTKSSSDYLALAAQTSGEQANSFLVNAAQQLFNEGQYKKALWLAQQTMAISDNIESKYQLTLIRAQSLLRLENIELAFIHIKAAENWRKQQPHSQRYFETLAAIQQKRNLPLSAIDAKLRGLALQPLPNYQQQAPEVWQALNALSQWEVDLLSQLAPPYFEGWKQLLNFAHRFGYQPSTFKRYLVQWQRDFADHPASILLSSLMENNHGFNDNEHNIAIILPLSGKQKTAGEVAQQGILAAYNNAASTTLHFIDAETINYELLAEKLTELNIDHVIGPLLKNNVDTYLAQGDINLPTLLLNLPQSQSLRENHIVLSMNPEDEAIQAATTLSRKQFNSPIVFAQQDNISQRIATAFSNQWQRINGRAPEVIAFEDASKVQEKLESTLELDLSKARIQDIDRRIRQKLKTQERNRLDIDMIYIVASPNETRLLKPYIDVNISPFARSIPVFASSRSHSDNSDESDSRDLSGLSFTEMPWQLNSKQQNKSLKQLSAKIWPTRSDSLERIFAMGYDSFALIKKFAAFKQQPYIRHFGQTGVLKLNQQGVLTRSLLWGSYQKDRVEEIVME